MGAFVLLASAVCLALSGGSTPVAPDIAAVVDIGDAKQPRPYDSFVAAALTDIENWWSQEFPRLYGEPLTPLRHGIFAAYPERTTPSIPPCGGDDTTLSYERIGAGVAFYCPVNDYIVYDDGPMGSPLALSNRYGVGLLGVILSHEYGHMIQERIGMFDENLPMVLREQQADCFSGAWSRRAWSGEADFVAFADADLRAAMVGLSLVKDLPGPNLYEAPAHGSGFDRIGAWQHGFLGGLDSCASLAERPLQLLGNEIDPAAPPPAAAPYGFADGQAATVFADDLSSFWPLELAAHHVTIPAITVRPVTNPTVDNCGFGPNAIARDGVAWCAATSEVMLDDQKARTLYGDQTFGGDFAVGYLIGHAWADAVQQALGLSLTGENRSLVSDCLVGAWTAGALPPPDNATAGDITTTTTSPLHPSGRVRRAPGDLDEAAHAAIEVGDADLDDDVAGSAFERIAYLRAGVQLGTEHCLDIAATFSG